MNQTTIRPNEYIHPRERAATEKIAGISETKDWLQDLAGDDIDEINRYICAASYLNANDDPGLSGMLSQAMERFDVHVRPDLFIARRFSYEVQLSGYDAPAIIIPASLVEEGDERILLSRVLAAVASIRAGHHRLEFLLWNVENMAGTVPIPFAGQAITAMLYEWKRAMAYSQDRAVYLATGDLELALRNILYGVVPAEILNRFSFVGNDTFAPQVDRYGQGVLENTVGKLMSFMQDKAYLPERYRGLVEFAQGRREI